MAATSFSGCKAEALYNREQHDGFIWNPSSSLAAVYEDGTTGVCKFVLKGATCAPGKGTGAGHWDSFVLLPPASDDDDAAALKAAWHPSNCPMYTHLPGTCWGNTAYQVCHVDRAGAYDAIMKHRGNQRAMYDAYVRLTTTGVGCTVAVRDRMCSSSPQFPALLPGTG